MEIRSIDPVTLAASAGVAIEIANLLVKEIEDNAKRQPRIILAEAKSEPLVHLDHQQMVKMVARQNYQNEITGLTAPTEIVPDTNLIRKESKKTCTLAALSLKGTDDESQTPSGRYTFFNRTRTSFNTNVKAFYIGFELSPIFLLGLKKTQSKLSPINPVVMDDRTVVYVAHPKSRYFEQEVPTSAIYFNETAIPIGNISAKYARLGKTSDGMAYMTATDEENKHLSCMIINTRPNRYSSFVSGNYQRFDLDVKKIIELSSCSKFETVRTTPWFIQNSIYWFTEVSSFDEKVQKNKERSIIVTSTKDKTDFEYKNMFELLSPILPKEENITKARIVDIVEYYEKNKLQRIIVFQMSSADNSSRKFLLLDEEGRVSITDSKLGDKYIETVKPVRSRILSTSISSISISDGEINQKIDIPKFSKNYIKIL